MTDRASFASFLDQVVGEAGDGRGAVTAAWARTTVALATSTLLPAVLMPVIVGRKK